MHRKVPDREAFYHNFCGEMPPFFKEQIQTPNWRF